MGELRTGELTNPFSQWKDDTGNAVTRSPIPIFDTNFNWTPDSMALGAFLSNTTSYLDFTYGIQFVVQAQSLALLGGSSLSIKTAPYDPMFYMISGYVPSSRVARFDDRGFFFLSVQKNGLLNVDSFFRYIDLLWITWQGIKDNFSSLEDSTVRLNSKVIGYEDQYMVEDMIYSTTRLCYQYQPAMNTTQSKLPIKKIGSGIRIQEILNLIPAFDLEKKNRIEGQFNTIITTINSGNLNLTIGVDTLLTQSNTKLSTVQDDRINTLIPTVVSEGRNLLVSHVAVYSMLALLILIF
jgi:hypothetical protein